MRGEWTGLIRTAAPADMPRVVEMVAALAAHHGEVASLTEDRLRGAIRDGLQVLVAEQDGGLIGYAALLPVIRLQFGQRGLDLHHLFTDARQRGAGGGTALVEASIALARRSGCRYIQVAAHEDNHRAHGFYASIGFVRSRKAPARFGMDLTEAAGNPVGDP